MAFGRLQRSPTPQPMSDINMTPLIDVMLVLLVIFMITAPLMTSSLKLDLPKTDAAQPADTPSYVSVAIDPQGKLYFGEEAVDADTFAKRIGETARKNPQTSAAARRQDRPLRPGRRTHRRRAEGRTEPNRLRRSAHQIEPPSRCAPAPKGRHPAGWQSQSRGRGLRGASLRLVRG